MLTLNSGACHSARNENRVCKRGDNHTAREGPNWTLCQGSCKLRLDVEEQAYIAGTKLLPVIQRGGNIGLPQPHIAIIDTCEDFPYKARTHRPGHSQSSHWIPQQVNTIGQPDIWAQFTDCCRHGCNCRPVGMHRIWPFALVPEHTPTNTPFFQ